LSITAIASGIFDDRPDLPSIAEKIGAYQARAADVDWEDEHEVREYLVGGWKLLKGTRHPFNDEQAVALAGEEIRQANNLMSVFNHARMTGGEELYGKVDSIRIPVLVIHGDEDPVLPYARGKALADTIPHARLDLT